MRRVARLFASPTGAIIRELVAASQGDPLIAEEFRTRFFAARRLRAAATLASGIESGELRVDLDIETTIDLLYAPVWLRLLVGHQTLTRTAADRILTHIWPALQAPGTAPPLRPGARSAPRSRSR